VRPVSLENPHKLRSDQVTHVDSGSFIISPTTNRLTQGLNSQASTPVETEHLLKEHIEKIKLASPLKHQISVQVESTCTKRDARQPSSQVRSAGSRKQFAARRGKKLK